MSATFMDDKKKAFLQFKLQIHLIFILNQFFFAHTDGFCLTCFFRRSVFEAWSKLCKHGIL